MIELTERQSQELAGLEAIVLDPWTKKQYVLVQKEYYERLRGGRDEDSASLMAPLLADLDPEDWEDASAYEGKE
jgi:hypothetical protein